MSTPELQPDADEVLQVEGYGHEPEVKVCVTKPVRVQPLPRKAAGTIIKAVAAAAGSPPAVMILRADPRRASAYLVSDVDIRVAFTSATAQQLATMALWPLGTPLPITATTDVYVAANAAAGTVSAIVEYWATGQDGGE